jgi:hypothetical protein
MMCAISLPIKNFPVPSGDGVLKVYKESLLLLDSGGRGDWQLATPQLYTIIMIRILFILPMKLMGNE